MEQYSKYATPPAPQSPMFISPQVYKNPTNVYTKERTGCTSCTSTLISYLGHQAKHQAHLSIAKALFTPIITMICIILGQILQRTASLSKGGFQASLLKSLLAGFVGGQCLVGSVIILNVVFDTGPTPGRMWHRHFTFTSMFIIFLAAGAAGPLGAKIVNIKEDPNTTILDPWHAFYSSGLAAGLIFWILLIVKALLLSHRKLDMIDSYNSTTTICTEINWDYYPHGCKDYDCNCCRGCTDCGCCDSRCCDCCDCCKGCGGCGGCGGGCDCNCNC